MSTFRYLDKSAVVNDGTTTRRTVGISTTFLDVGLKQNGRLDNNLRVLDLELIPV